MDENYAKKLVIERLMAMPPDTSFLIGCQGDFTRNQLIDEVMNGSKVGKAAIEMEINFIKAMPKISQITP